MAGHIASAGRVDWNTPDSILKGVWNTFGGQIGLDPCSNSNSLVAAAREYRLDCGEDGLVLPWEADTIFINPPFGRSYVNAAKRTCLSKKEWDELPEDEQATYRASTIASWVEKAALAAANGSEVVMLLPAAVDTAHWQKHILSGASAVCFPKGRLKFVGAAAGAPMACALVYWNGSAGTAGTEAFQAAFASHGKVLNLGISSVS